jgi:hypothetical protein
MDSNLYAIDNFTSRANADKMHESCFNIDSGSAENLLNYIEGYGLLEEENFKMLKELIEQAEENSLGNIGRFDRKHIKQ